MKRQRGRRGGGEREREREIIVEKWLTTARQRRTLKIKGSRQTSQLGSGSSDVRKTANLAILWRFRQVIGAVLYVLMQRTHRIFFAFTGRRRRISRGQLSLLHASWYWSSAFSSCSFPAWFPVCTCQKFDQNSHSGTTFFRLGALERFGCSIPFLDLRAEAQGRTLFKDIWPCRCPRKGIYLCTRWHDHHSYCRFLFPWVPSRVYSRKADLEPCGIVYVWERKRDTKSVWTHSEHWAYSEHRDRVRVYIVSRSLRNQLHYAHLYSCVSCQNRFTWKKCIEFMLI